MPKKPDPQPAPKNKSGWLDQLVDKVNEADQKEQAKRTAKTKSTKKSDDRQYQQNSYLKAFLKHKKERTIIWFSGIFKEFSRINWLKGTKLWSTLFVVLVVLVIGSVIFYLVVKLASLI